ncbi:hypothetical protein ACOTTU_23050 [Roseobacter sp. EG26]|uniref:cellulase family glycosylhydrolase n=1 Tax=Roseobacter sp. EG26 TaxID=3412477 RepID=UPI003CE4B4CB
MRSVVVNIFFASLLAMVVSPAKADGMEGWHRYQHNPYSSVPDLSFLNEKPSGQRGRVIAKGAELAFEDGTSVKFWGANLQAYALFATEPRHIKAQAKRIAALGFNLVRIHHHDSLWVQPNVFDAPAENTRTLNISSMKRLDLWLEALKAEGIYIWLDLHVGRRMVANDQITWFEEIAQDGHADVRGFNFISQSIQARMLEFQRQYLGYRNHLTGIRYADDPAIIAVLVSNENDLTHHFGNRLLPDKQVPEHNQLYMSEAKAFAKAHGLSQRRTWKSWEYGPSKIFLNDLERRFFDRMSADLRKIGFDGLIAPTNFWGKMPVSSLPSLSQGSMIDVHSYGANAGLGMKPHVENDLLSWIASGQVADMPLTISEWNIGKFPVEDRFVAPLRMATLAAHHGWDAPIIYGYSQQSLSGPLQPSNWSVASDPAILASLPASALLFRQGHVRPAKKTYAIRLSADALFDEEVSPNTSMALRTLYEQSAVVIELPEVKELTWMKPRRAASSAIPVEDLGQSFLDVDAGIVEADTGDFSRNFSEGVFSVNTENSQLIAGAMAGHDIVLDALAVQIGQPLAFVSLQSLDSVAIERSGDLLISFSARSQPANDDDPLFLVEPLTGELRVRAAPGLTLRDLKGNPLPSKRVEGWYVIDLEDISNLRWIRLGKF